MFPKPPGARCAPASFMSKYPTGSGVKPRGDRPGPNLPACVMLTQIRCIGLSAAMNAVAVGLLVACQPLGPMQRKRAVDWVFVDTR